MTLRQAIANYIFKKEQLTYSPENEILVSVGAMEGLYLSLLATIDSGDEVIIPAPYYVNYKQMVEMCGGVPIIVEDYDHIKEFKCSVNKNQGSDNPQNGSNHTQYALQPHGQSIQPRIHLPNCRSFKRKKSYGDYR